LIPADLLRLLPSIELVFDTDRGHPLCTTPCAEIISTTSIRKNSRCTSIRSHGDSAIIRKRSSTSRSGGKRSTISLSSALSIVSAPRRRCGSRRNARRQECASSSRSAPRARTSANAPTCSFSFANCLSSASLLKASISIGSVMLGDLNPISPRSSSRINVVCPAAAQRERADRPRYY
jgi:hypothetical protein